MPTRYAYREHGNQQRKSPTPGTAKLRKHLQKSITNWQQRSNADLAEVTIAVPGNTYGEQPGTTKVVTH